MHTVSDRTPRCLRSLEEDPIHWQEGEANLNQTCLQLPLVGLVKKTLEPSTELDHNPRQIGMNVTGTRKGMVTIHMVAEDKLREAKAQCQRGQNHPYTPTRLIGHLTDPHPLAHQLEKDGRGQEA